MNSTNALFIRAQSHVDVAELFQMPAPPPPQTTSTRAPSFEDFCRENDDERNAVEKKRDDSRRMEKPKSADDGQVDKSNHTDGDRSTASAAHDDNAIPSDGSNIQVAAGLMTPSPVNTDAATPPVAGSEPSGSEAKTSQAEGPADKATGGAAVAGQETPTVEVYGQAATALAAARVRPGSVADGNAKADGTPAADKVPTTDTPATGTAGASETVSAKAIAAGEHQKAEADKMSVNDREKFAALFDKVTGRDSAPAENTILASDQKQVANSGRGAGTGIALPGEIMPNAFAASPSVPGQGALGVAQSEAGSGPAVAEDFSVTWKGWTNGDGEKSSTAAQFSRLSDKLSVMPVPNVGAAGQPTARSVAAPTPATATRATYPVESAELMAPIGSAIERLLTHGRDHLALAVQFEQGGSLSLKLAMHNGQISTQIHTDVPGLESALRSSWNDFAQQWENRGWKLGNPEFTTSTGGHPQDQFARDGRSAGQQGAANESGHAGSSRIVSQPRVVAASAVSSSVHVAAPDAHERRGLQTWA